MYDSREVVFVIDKNGIDYQRNLVAHPVWHLETIRFEEIEENSRYDLFNLDIKLDNSSLQIYKPKESKVIRFTVVIKRSPLYIMINGVVPSFILNLVILLAFSLSFDTQIGLCK